MLWLHQDQTCQTKPCQTMPDEARQKKLLSKNGLAPSGTIWSGSSWRWCNQSIRHETIQASIGYFPEEGQAYSVAKNLIFVLPAAVVLTTVTDIVLVICYMKWIHPWRKIIQQKPFLLNLFETVGTSDKIISNEQNEITKL